MSLLRLVLNKQIIIQQNKKCLSEFTDTILVPQKKHMHKTSNKLLDGKNLSALARLSDIRLCPQSGAAPCELASVYITVTNSCCSLVTCFEIAPYLHYPCQWANCEKKTASTKPNYITYCNATTEGLSQGYRQHAQNSIRFDHVVPEIMSWPNTDKTETYRHRHVHHSTPLPYLGHSKCPRSVINEHQ